MSSTWNEQWEVERHSEYWKIPDDDVRSFLSDMKSSGRTTILDYGCGIGRHSILSAQEGFTVTAIDPSENAVEYLRSWAKKEHLKIDCICGDLSSTQERFDIILCFNVIYHGTRNTMQHLLNEIHSRMDDGSILYFTCPTHDDGKYGYGEELEPHTFVSSRSVHPGDLHYFLNRKDLLELLSRFRVVEMKRDEHYWENNGSEEFSSYWKVTCSRK